MLRNKFLKSTCLVTIVFKPNVSQSDLYSLNSMKKLANEVDFYVIGIKKYFLSNERVFLQTLGQECIFIEFEEGYFRSIESYNLLMQSIEFYSEFLNYNYVLICQLDTIVIRDNLVKFTSSKYNYLGAPWMEKSKATRHLLVGNGGLSLRRTVFFYSSLKRFSLLSSKFWLWYSKTFFYKIRVINYPIGKVLWIAYRLGAKKLFFDSLKFQKVYEDVSFSKFIKYSKGNIPPLNFAVDFSFESMPEICYQLNDEKLPFGCHAPEKYNPKFWIEKGILSRDLLSH